MLIATFLINKTHSPVLKNKTPFSLLYDTPMDYTFLKVFGRHCFASTLLSHINKFHPLARARVFVGYPPGIKGYKLYDISSKSFVVSRDVFHENHFPFHSIPYTTNLINSFPDIVLPQIAPDLPIYHRTSTSPSNLPLDSNNNVHFPH